MKSDRSFSPSSGRKLTVALALALFSWGCGADPVRTDLEDYHQQVIRPVSAAEETTVADMESFRSALEAKQVSYEKLLTKYRGELLPRYEELVRLLTDHKAKTPAVRSINEKLLELYVTAVKILKDCVTGLEKKDLKSLEEAHKRLAQIDFASFRKEIEALARKHGASFPQAPAAAPAKSSP